MRSQCGVTLIELLIVVTILGIVSVVALPTLATRDDLRLAAAARVIIADIAYAQSQALSQRQRHYVQFSGQQYALLHDNGASIVATPHPVSGGNYVVAFGSGALAQVTVAQSSFGGAGTVGFDTLGSPASYNSISHQFTPLAASGFIRLQSGEQILTISIEPYTGEMSVSND